MCHTFTWIAHGECLNAETKRETLARIFVDELAQAVDSREKKGALKLTHWKSEAGVRRSLRSVPYLLGRDQREGSIDGRRGS